MAESSIEEPYDDVKVTQTTWFTSSLQDCLMRLNRKIWKKNRIRMKGWMKDNVNMRNRQWATFWQKGVQENFNVEESMSFIVSWHSYLEFDVYLT